MKYSPLFAQLVTALKPANRWSQIRAVLNYDDRTIRPAGGAAGSADRLGFAEEQGHLAFTSPAVQDALEKCSAGWEELTEVEKLAVRRLKLCMMRAVALPSEFVARRGTLFSQAGEVWKAARANNDFGSYAPILMEVFDLIREEADYLGATHGDADSIYDTKLQEYEPGMTTADIRPILTQVGEWMTLFVKRIQEAGGHHSDQLLRGHFSVGRQRQFMRFATETIGYDYSRGVFAETAHPFASSVCHGDHRITGRFREDYLGSALFGTTHEAGHAMFEQGTPEIFWDIDNTAIFVSLGIHESQSRLWENMVGRSKSYWKYMLPYLKLLFPRLRGVSLDDFYTAINVITPSPIRVEADEVTYNGHILVRFEIEQALLSNDLRIVDAPAAFADLMEKYVGYRPKTHAEGILQDTHWSMGLVGYFPTYTLGNLTAAQLFRSANDELPLDDDFEEGDFSRLLDWLRDNVHRRGHLSTLNGMLEHATGELLNPEHWFRYIEEKFGELYQLES